jgi:hypothetical protein
MQTYRFIILCQTYDDDRIWRLGRRLNKIEACLPKTGQLVILFSPQASVGP